MRILLFLLVFVFSTFSDYGTVFAQKDSVDSGKGGNIQDSADNGGNGRNNNQNSAPHEFIGEGMGDLFYAEGYDEGLYTSLIMAYKNAFGEADYEEVLLGDRAMLKPYGVFYTRLVDFNHDGYNELVIAYRDKENANYDNCVHVYGFIDEQLTLMRVFNPYYSGINDEIVGIELVTVNHPEYGVSTYIVEGYDRRDEGNRRYWGLSTFGFGFHLGVELGYDISDTGGRIPIVNGYNTTQDDYDYMAGIYADPDLEMSYTTIYPLNPSSFMPLMEENMAMNLPAPSNASTPAATFNGSQFVIFELAPEEAEPAVKEYFESLVRNDLPRLANSVVGLDIPMYQNMIENRQQIPGYIIHSMLPISVGFDDDRYSDLSRALAHFGAVEGSYDSMVIEAVVTEVVDLSYSDYVPQLGYGTHKYWFLLLQTDDKPYWHIHEVYSEQTF